MYSLKLCRLTYKIATYSDMSADGVYLPKENFHPSFCSRVVISTQFGHYLSIIMVVMNYNPHGAHSR
jgi:hypothetical protein